MTRSYKRLKPRNHGCSHAFRMKCKRGHWPQGLYAPKPGWFRDPGGRREGRRWAKRCASRHRRRVLRLRLLKEEL